MSKDRPIREIRVGNSSFPLIIQGGVAIIAVVLIVWIVFSRMFP